MTTLNILYAFTGSPNLYSMINSLANVQCGMSSRLFCIHGLREVWLCWSSTDRRLRYNEISVQYYWSFRELTLDWSNTTFKNYASMESLVSPSKHACFKNGVKINFALCFMLRISNISGILEWN